MTWPQMSSEAHLLFSDQGGRHAVRANHVAIGCALITLGSIHSSGYTAAARCSTRLIVGATLRYTSSHYSCTSRGLQNQQGFRACSRAVRCAAGISHHDSTACCKDFVSESHG